MSSRFIELIDTQTRDKITAPLKSAWTLPPAAYTDPSIFAEEVEKMFLRDWICVARVEQVPHKGDYLCVDLPGLPLVISRDFGGLLHALSRICLHRATPVATGQGSTRQFVCPHHNWTYGLDGYLRNAPMMQTAEGFSPQTCRLPALQLEVWNGFIFVNADPQAQPLQPQLRGLEAHLRNYNFEPLRIADTLYFPSPWNWKILVENFMEAYHHIGTHKYSLELDYPARQSTVPDNNGPWAFLAMPGETPAAASLSSFATLSDSQRKSLFAAAVFPSFLIAASNQVGLWYQLKPNAYDQMDLYIHILLHPELNAAMTPDDLIETRNRIVDIHKEDIAANKGPWQGLNGRLTTQGRLCSLEKAIWQLNQYWIQRMAAA